MKTASWRRWALCVSIAGGSLFGGTCGITDQQLRDFLVSSVIRTSVTTLASITEAAILEEAQQRDDG